MLGLKLRLGGWLLRRRLGWEAAMLQHSLIEGCHVLLPRQLPLTLGRGLLG